MLNQAKSFLAKFDVHFQPGLNEDLATNSIWGTQQATRWPINTEAIERADRASQWA